MMASTLRGIGFLVMAAVLCFVAFASEGGQFGRSELREQQFERPAPAVFSHEKVEALTVEPQNDRDKLERWEPLLVHERGAAYRRSRVVRHSLYLQPLSAGKGLRGRSRIWGDADLDVQAECIERIVRQLQDSDFSEDEICFALALVRCESGFNPDAAAGISSACGLGQFLDRTRAVLCERAGIENSDPFSVDLNVACLQETLEECFRFARKRASRDTLDYFAYAYAYHHDGPKLNAGGLEIARSKVLPWLETAKRCIVSP